MAEKMAGAEKAGNRQDKAITRLERVTKSHSFYLIELNRHLEDLDTRGRRHNIRVRGIPETAESDDITSALQSVFNNLLEHQADAPIKFERALRAKRRVLSH